MCNIFGTSQGNIARAAKTLGIDRRSPYRMRERSKLWDHRDINRFARAVEVRDFVATGGVDRPGEEVGIVGDNANRAATEAPIFGGLTESRMSRGLAVTCLRLILRPAFVLSSLCPHSVGLSGGIYGTPILSPLRHYNDA
jgi:hypothetical protein